jgi:hypothetical protein
MKRIGAQPGARKASYMWYVLRECPSSMGAGLMRDGADQVRRDLFSPGASAHAPPSLPALVVLSVAVALSPRMPWR